MSNKTEKVLATSSGLYAIKDGKTFECPVNKEFSLDEGQAEKLCKTGKLKYVTNDDKPIVIDNSSSVKSVVAKIESADSAEFLEQFMDDDRKGVQTAIEKKLNELEI